MQATPENGKGQRVKTPTPMQTRGDATAATQRQRSAEIIPRPRRGLAHGRAAA